MTSRPRSVRPWLLAAFALCGFPIVARTLHPLAEQLFVPVTPLDRTDVARASQWRFLESCRPHFPPASSLTVIADDRHVEMALFMMSIGAFPESVPMPTSYYGVAKDEGRHAEYVLAYRRAPPADWPLRLIAEVDDGAVYARVPAP